MRYGKYRNNDFFRVCSRMRFISLEINEMMHNDLTEIDMLLNHMINNPEIISVKRRITIAKRVLDS